MTVKFLNGCDPLDSNKVKQICSDRLQRWIFKLLTEHSTPVCLIGIGHDHKQGQVTVCIPEDFTDDVIIGMLEVAIFNLKKGNAYK